MSFCPFFIDLKDLPIMVVGESHEAYQICKTLVAKEALVTIWTKEISAPLRQLKDEAKDHLSILRAELTPEMAEQILAGKNAPRLLFIAADDPAYGLRLQEIAKQHRVLCQLIGDSQSLLQIGNLVDRGGLSLAVFANDCPELATAIQAEIDEYYSRNWRAAYYKFKELSESFELGKLSPAERSIELGKLARALVKAEGNLEDALGILSGNLEIHEEN